MLGGSWGVREDEERLPFACDLFVTDPALVAHRGTTVAAAPADVWPWVCQIRVAPYSYDLVDNLGRRSPRELLDLPEPRVGDPFTASGGRPLGEVEDVEPGRSLTGRVMGAHLTYLLQPAPGDSTRLLLKVVMETGPLVARAVCLGDLVMARRQLLNLRRLAEASVTGR